MTDLWAMIPDHRPNTLMVSRETYKALRRMVRLDQMERRGYTVRWGSSKMRLKIKRNKHGRIVIRRIK